MWILTFNVEMMIGHWKDGVFVPNKYNVLYQKRSGHNHTLVTK